MQDAQLKWSHHFYPAASHPHLGHPPKQTWFADTGFLQCFAQQDVRALCLLIKKCYVPFYPLGVYMCFYFLDTIFVT